MRVAAGSAHMTAMTPIRSVPGFASLRFIPNQPLQVRPDTIVHPTLAYARRHRQYGTVLCEVELALDDTHQFGIFFGPEPDWAACSGRRPEYWEAYIALLDARRRDDRAIIRLLQWRETTGQDILANITDSLIIKDVVGKAA